jgi:biopolymer transport protein ExbD
MAAAKKFFFDVWLIQGNMVYRSVPYEVVTDWIQQGRLLTDDRIRPTGTEEWFELGRVPAFAGFLPAPEPLRTDAAAESLEPMESSFSWGKKGEEEEADPDMIPLIDVSLVLLIFFMLTSAVASSASVPIPLPALGEGATLESNPRVIWIGIEYASENQPPRYRMTFSDQQNPVTKTDLSEDQVLKTIEDILQVVSNVQEIRVAADKRLAFDLIKHMSVELERFKQSGRISNIKIEVGEKK